MAQLQKHLSEHSTALKELNNMISARPSQLRNPRTKTIYEYFHSTVLPLIDTMDSASYRKIVKALSQLYRNPKLILSDGLDKIADMITSKGTAAPLRAPHNSIAEPPTPTHAVAESKKQTARKTVKVQAPPSKYKRDDPELMGMLVKAVRHAIRQEAEDDSDDAYEADDETVDDE
jgi:hypothetical protein